MANSELAIKKVLKHEGGYANVKGDRGGETYCGISRVHWPDWPGWVILDRHKPIKHNSIINDARLSDLVLAFYRSNFWNKMKGDDIADQRIAEFIFDWYVNSGGIAIRRTQRVAGVHDNGSVGKDTLTAINSPAFTFDALKASRVSFVNDIVKNNPSQVKFLAGWMNRINAL